jgi:hypothetical protein
MALPTARFGEDAMKNSVLTAALAVAFVSQAAVVTESVSGQNAILAEMYGRGVHAYYAGQAEEATLYLTMAIDNGSQDPRTYYFRGMVADAAGQTEQADADWKVGAEMEADGRTNPAIGRSLSRYQGSARLRLERIRQSARLQAMATAMSRSKQRYGEIQAAEATVVRSAPAGAAPVRPIAPPPVPSAIDDPFADDMAEGQPKVVAQDALKDAMNDPFADDGAPAAAPAGGGADPFGGAGGADPFGGGDAGGADPFGGGDAGGGDAGGADPFGGNPFGT